MKFLLVERLSVIAGVTALVGGIGVSSVGFVSAASVLGGKTCGSAKACVTYTNSGGGPGIEGKNSSGGGANAYGVLGVSWGSDGVRGTSTHDGSSGVAGIMTGTSSSNGNGVYGQSSDSSGKYAAIYAAGYNPGTYLFQGYNLSTNNHCTIDPNANLGCTGQLSGTTSKSSSSGVLGYVSGTTSKLSSSGVAGYFSGIGTGYGVYGEYDSKGSGSAVGAAIDAVAQHGGYGANVSNADTVTPTVYAENLDGGPSLVVVSDKFYNANEKMIEFINNFGGGTANNPSCNIDGLADLRCTGTIQGAGVHAQLTTTDGRHVLTYAPESATPTIEDLGAARLRDGAANIEIPADLASVMDRSNPYYVFLTPMGDTRGLYVGTQNASSFQVRENMHGRSNVSFEYRIIAVPRGAKNVRLPAAPEVKPPRLRKLPALPKAPTPEQ